MLAHPWIVGVMKQEVNMARWIQQIWDWPELAKTPEDV
jgi:mitogen-activated protein kinase kinase